jgi:hypothetical protein
MVVANMQDATQPDDEDCTITAIETRHGPACNIDAVRARLVGHNTDRCSHRTGAYTDKEDLVLCDA